MRQRAGFSIVEVVVAAFLAALMIGIVTEIVMTSGETMGSGIAVANVRARTNRVLDMIENELIRAGLTTLSPTAPAGETGLSYRRLTGYLDGSPQWSSPLRIEYRPDEDRVVWIRNVGLPSERVVTWATGVSDLQPSEIQNSLDDNDNGIVDDPGLYFLLDGNVLTIELALIGRDPRGRPIVESASTTIRIRN